MEPPSIMFVAGDPSGDEHASHVIRCLRERMPDCTCFGVGGPLMVAEGFEQVLPFEPFNRMGFAEVLTHLPFFLRAKKLLIDQLVARKAPLLVCIDYPGLNMELLKAASARGIRTLWYIAPKVWAWKKKRIPILGNHASAIATIFPFEPDIYKGFPAKAVYVGNPSAEAYEKRHAGRTERKAGEGGWRLALVPGSRDQEVRRILPSMVEAVEALKASFPAIELRVSVCRGLDEKLFAQCGKLNEIALHHGDLGELLEWADLAVVTSGTASLECALAEVPFVLVYKTSSLTWAIGKMLVKIPYVGLPNIIANKQVVPERLQGMAKPDVLVADINKFIIDEKFYLATVESFRELKSVLGSKTPSKEVADLISGLVKQA